MSLTLFALTATTLLGHISPSTTIPKMVEPVLQSSVLRSPLETDVL
jgi:hypothetical protein